MDEKENLTERRITRLIMEQTDYSDWIVLSLFHSNLGTVNFQNFIDDLAYYLKLNSKKAK